MRDEFEKLILAGADSEQEARLLLEQDSDGNYVAVGIQGMWACLNAGFRTGYRAGASAMRAAKPLSEDAVMELANSIFGARAMEVLTRTVWKDGIDLDFPSHDLMRFVAAIRALPLDEGGK